VLQNVYISSPYIVAARTAGTDKNEEITQLSAYVYLPTSVEVRSNCHLADDSELSSFLLVFYLHLFQNTDFGEVAHMLLAAWHSDRKPVFDRPTFRIPCSTCSWWWPLTWV